MIPILYEKNETSFTTNGLGALSEATECLVTEERNGEYELEMSYPVSGRLFSELTSGRLILAKPNDTSETQPFRIYKITKPMADEVQVFAEHISYDLSGIPVAPFSATGAVAALNGLKTNSKVENNFTVWTDIDNTTTTYTLKKPQSFRACLGGTDGSFLDTFSGSGGVEFEFDRFAVKAYRNRGADNGVTIRYGKNLTDLKQEESIESTYTGVLAFWSGSDGTLVTGEIQYVDNHENYPRERIYIYDASSDFDEAPTADDLNTRAAKYRDDNDVGSPSVNLEVSFAALWQTEEYKNIASLERVSLCDTVGVYFELLGISASAKVIKTVYNVLKERYDSIELGDAKSSFADTIRQTVSDTISRAVTSTKTSMQAAIDTATELICGGTGGYVVINRNANGQPNEILIMDTDSTDTAVNVIRMNKNGIGFSTTGYNGPFTSAWTIDGNFNADFITTGTIRAGLITAGILTDATGTNYWNLDTGDFSLSAYSTTDEMDAAIDEKIQKTVKSVDVEYAQNQSTATAPTDGWSTTAPTWADGYYIWSRTTTTYADGTTATTDPVCLAGAKGDTGATGNGATSITEQYYLSSSSTTQTGGSWSSDQTAWADGYYIWTRSVITWTDGTTTYTDPVPANAINGANEAANSANTTAAEAKTTADTASTTATEAKDTADAVKTDFDVLNTQEGVFNKLTNNGETQGVYMKNKKLYINATYIDTGTLDADLLRAGKITDSDGTNYWDLDSGEMVISSSATIAGWTISDNTMYRNITGSDGETWHTAFRGANETDTPNSWILQSSILDESTGNYSAQFKILADGTYTSVGGIGTSSWLTADTGVASHGLLRVDGNSTLTGTVTIGGNVTASSDMIVSGAGSVGGNLTVSGDATLKGGVTVSGSMTVSSPITVQAVEISDTTPYIDFHINSATYLDYTNRILCTDEHTMHFQSSNSSYSYYCDLYAHSFNQQSSVHVKHDIESMADPTSELMKLRPVTFAYTGSEDKQGGLIAEEVHDILPDIVAWPDGYDPDAWKEGDPTPGIDYSKLTPYLLAMCQEQEKRIRALEARVEALEKGE